LIDLRDFEGGDSKKRKIVRKGVKQSLREDQK
jgi:hypothetical protein